jgi:hypothetical protein
MCKGEAVDPQLLLITGEVFLILLPLHNVKVVVWCVLYACTLEKSFTSELKNLFMSRESCLKTEGAQFYQFL